MATDRHGLEVAGTTEAVVALDDALDGLLRFDPATLEHLAAARRADPECSMASVMAAYLGLGSTDGRSVPVALDDLGAAAAGAGRLTRREELHLQAAEVWAAGRPGDASVLLEQILIEHPSDLLALAIAHQLDFLRGDAAGLRRRPARSLPHLDPNEPRAGYVHGMLSFGLEESGTYDAALFHAEAALARCDDDVWAIHAAAHVFEMRGEVDEGLAHLDDRQPRWASDNWMHNHTAWHRCLFLLALGRVDEVLEAYDDELRHGGPDELPMPLCDAASLLWRLELAGVDVGGRWVELAGAWAGSLVSGHYPFNDLHAALALARGGAPGAATVLMGALEQARSRAEEPVVLEVGLTATSGLVAFAEHDDDDAIDLLLSVGGRDHVIGGSAAQRDLLALTIAAAAERGGHLALARSIAAERLTLQPGSPATQRTAGRLGVRIR